MLREFSSWEPASIVFDNEHVMLFYSELAATNALKKARKYLKGGGVN